MLWSLLVSAKNSSLAVSSRTFLRDLVIMKDISETTDKIPLGEKANSPKEEQVRMT